MENPRDMMGFGSQEEWQRFNVNFPVFVDKHVALEALRDKMFVRKIYPKHPNDYIIYGLGRVCVEDFEQVLNLCGNGFGIGGMQILRGMYERQVTTAYLTKYPEEVINFVDYHHVHTRKALNHLKDVYRGDKATLNGIVSEADQERIQRDFADVEEKFTEVTCGTCNKTRIMISWSKHHTGVLARKAGQDLDKLYYYLYYRPTLLSHSTFASVDARVVFKEDGSFSFESDGQRNHVKDALLSAHNLLLNVFDLQNKHFNLGLDTEIEQCMRDYLECWAPNELPPT
jgi:hypothetical protein